MARNLVWETATQIGVIPTEPAEPVSGDPVLLGTLPGVALTDPDEDGMVTMKTDGAFRLPVEAVNGSGNSAIVPGDAIYYVAANDPVLSKVATGVYFGYAIEAADAGSTTEIIVKIGY